MNVSQIKKRSSQVNIWIDFDRSTLFSLHEYRRVVCNTFLTLLLSPFIWLKMYILIIFIIFSQNLIINGSEFKLRMTASHLLFQANHTIDLLTIHFNVKSTTYCGILCANNVRCQTADFDEISGQCRLFSKPINEGILIGPPQATAKSRVIYIDEQIDFYSLFNKTCDPVVDYNRFLSCVNSQWQCPPGLFWNATKCQRQHLIGEICRSTEWCDEYRYLICLTDCAICACNRSMTWNGSSCIPSRIHLKTFSFVFKQSIFRFSIQVCPSSQYGVTFDDICNATGLSYYDVPFGYADVTWTNTRIFEPTSSQTGYLMALSSGSFVAYNPFGFRLSIGMLNRPFEFHSATVSAAHFPSLSVRFKGTDIHGAFRIINIHVFDSYPVTVTLGWGNLSLLEIWTPLSLFLDQMSFDNICLGFN